MRRFAPALSTFREFPKCRNVGDTYGREANPKSLLPSLITPGPFKAFKRFKRFAPFNRLRTAAARIARASRFGNFRKIEI